MSANQVPPSPWRSGRPEMGWSSARTLLEDPPTPVISNCPARQMPPLITLPSSENESREKYKSRTTNRVARFSSASAKPIIVTRPLVLSMETPLILSSPRIRARPLPLPVMVPSIALTSMSIPDVVFGGALASRSALNYCTSLLPPPVDCLRFFGAGALRVARRYNQSTKKQKLLLLGSIPSPSKQSPKTVVGIRNYGQTCFLNSVLQSLSSLDTFVAFLQHIVSFNCLDEDKSLRLDTSDALVSDMLLNLIYSANGKGPRNVAIDPRDLLQAVGKKHKQFRSTVGMGRAGVGKEQQDAEEFLQSLVGMVIEDAELDATPSAVQIKFVTPDVAVDSSDDDDEILTVVSGARERQKAETEEVEPHLGRTIAVADAGAASEALLALSFSTDLPAEHVANADPLLHSIKSKRMLKDERRRSPTQYDEKKQDEFALSGPGSMDDHPLPAIGPIDTANGTEVETMGDIAAKEKNLSSAMRMMLYSTSSITPSPLCGWLGSAVQCRRCSHVRPIQNAPFLDIPVVPTAVSNYLFGYRDRTGPSEPPVKQSLTFNGRACTLQACLEEFTSIERVLDVECRSCTQKREIDILKDEVIMLRGGIQTLEARAKHRSVSEDDPALHLREELHGLESKLKMLSTVSPDEEGTMERVLSMGGTLANGTKLRLERCDAFKCLLLTRLPSVLCIHIQRRFYDPLSNRMTKTSQHVLFPEFLDVGPYCAYGGALHPVTSWGTSQKRQAKRPINYKLMSVIEHYGSAHYGHYVSYRRDPGSGNWIYISDDAVEKVSWARVRNCQAYMLFYEAI